MKLPLQKLYLKDFRNCEGRLFEFGARTALLLGANGRGKTNVLESVFFLSVLRSFRTSNLAELARLGTGGFEILALVGGAESVHKLSVRQAGKLRRLVRDGEAVRRSSEFIDNFRAVALVPEDLELTAGPSSRRRRFFDMLISVNSPAYRAELQTYLRALAERNAALKKNAETSIVRAYDEVLSALVPALCAARRETAAALEKETVRLLEEDSLRIRYAPAGPEQAEAFAAALEKELASDRRRGFTGTGLQGDEFRIEYRGRDLRIYGSNGQKRKIALFLRLAELALVKRAPGGVVALVDDVGGELDRENRERFFRALGVADQLIFTFAQSPEESFFSDAERIGI